MKDQWYADNRDLIKWGGIVQLCNETKIKNVIQVAYHREWQEGQKPKLNFDGNKVAVPIPEEVVEHFRNINDIKRLGKKAGLNIDVEKSEFSQQNRQRYTKDVCQQSRKTKEPKIVFLDPDTGLLENAKAEHVKPIEVSKIWESLNPGDYLAFYQHNTHQSDWRKKKKKELAKAIKVNGKTIKIWKASEKVNDVIFFFAENNPDNAFL